HGPQLDWSRRFEPLLGHLERAALVLDRAKETGLVTFMTGRTDLFDLDQQRVAITVEGDVFDTLGVAAGLAFPPEFLARTAPEMGLAGLDGGLEGRAVHPGHHQYAAGGLLLNDGRDET